MHSAPQGQCWITSTTPDRLCLERKRNRRNQHDWNVVYPADHNPRGDDHHLTKIKKSVLSSIQPRPKHEIRKVETPPVTSLPPRVTVTHHSGATSYSPQEGGRRSTGRDERSNKRRPPRPENHLQNQHLRHLYRSQTQWAIHQERMRLEALPSGKWSTHRTSKTPRWRIFNPSLRSYRIWYPQEIICRTPINQEWQNRMNNITPRLQHMTMILTCGHGWHNEVQSLWSQT